MINFVRSKLYAIKMMLYRHLYIPYRAREIRKKDTINVTFLLSSLAGWKSESLYILMGEHPRFNPIILAFTSGEEDDRESIFRYCKNKGYNVEVLEGLPINLWDKYRGDIIFFQKPYGDDYSFNLKSLFCYIPYGMRNTYSRWNWDCAYLHNCWQVYFENAELAKSYGDINTRFGYNHYATATPFMDDLLCNDKKMSDPWKPNTNYKKRIIYAPHHSIADDSWFNTGSFLKNGEDILRLAEKYSDKVQWLFKPHPLLRRQLENVWGKSRTDEYYRKWTESEWSQFNNEDYLSFFKNSDAMIHDCGSFAIEYIYSGKPVMYLIKNDSISNDWNALQMECFNLHSKGYTVEDIEAFILSVIRDEDEMRENRTQIVAESLTPPKNQTASQNIIDCILSEKAARSVHYKKC